MTTGGNLNDENLEPKMPTKRSADQSTRMRRRNFSFRKMLCPRSACQVLGSLLGQLPFKDFVQCEQVTTGFRQRKIPVFLARIEYDGQSFESCAESKPAAENDCSEKVLMYITSKSCQEEEEEEEERDEGEEKGESNIPWVSLASLALFNMFNHWERQGNILPKSITRQQMQPGRLKPELRNISQQDQVKSFGVAKGFGKEESAKLLPTTSEALLKPDKYDAEPTCVKGANKRLENVKGVPKASSEIFQPVSLATEKAKTKTEHTIPYTKAISPNNFKLNALIPIQMSPSTRCKLPVSMLSPLSPTSSPASSSSSASSSSPSSSLPLLTVPKFELGWKHPMTLLNDLAGPKLVIKEVQLFLVITTAPIVILIGTIILLFQVGEIGKPPNCLFTVGVCLDGATFYGEGWSKKEARRAAATNALDFLFKTTHPTNQ